MSAPQLVTLTIPAASDFIAVARLSASAVAARLNFAVEEIEDIKIALSEACTNAIQHAYEAHHGAATIDICFYVFTDKLEISVTDTGKGFDPKTAVSSKTLSLSDQSFGLGLGLTFIKSLMDEAQIESRAGKGTVVKMVKYLSQTLPA